MYPPLKLKSKLDIAQRLISKKRTFEESKKLVNAAKKDKDLFWKDHKTMTETKKEKYVRYAKPKSPLWVVLKQVNNWLRSWDSLLPCHIYGGRINRSTAQAAVSLLVGQGKNRFLLKTDLSRFFEQVERDRIFSFFKNRSGCSLEASNYMADLCVVPEGPKNAPRDTKTLARGFSPSTRLATWCNVEFFYKLAKMVRSHFKHLRVHPRIIVYVDDILISVSNVGRVQVEELRGKILVLANRFDLKINEDKTKIYLPKDEQEVLGILMHRRSLSVPLKSRQKLSRLKVLKRKTADKEKNKKLKKQIDGMYQNKAQLKVANQALKERRNSNTKS